MEKPPGAACSQASSGQRAACPVRGGRAEVGVKGSEEHTQPRGECEAGERGDQDCFSALTSPGHWTVGQWLTLSELQTLVESELWAPASWESWTTSGGVFRALPQGGNSANVTVARTVQKWVVWLNTGTVTVPGNTHSVPCCPKGSPTLPSKCSPSCEWARGRLIYRERA